MRKWLYMSIIIFCLFITFLTDDDFYAIKHNRTKCAMDSSTGTGCFFLFSQGFERVKDRPERERDEYKQLTCSSPPAHTHTHIYTHTLKQMLAAW